MTLCVAEASSTADLRRFERIAEVLHGNSSSFVPPFPGGVAKYLQPKSAFNRIHGRIIPFVAWRDDVPVGRVAAILNRTHNRLNGDRTGFFGFFECIDDDEVSRELFDRAAAALRDLGLTAMRGPYNPSINDECGLLVDGFETPPCMGLTWNPPFYERLVTASGFQPLFTLSGLDLPLSRLELPERLTRMTERIATRSKLSLRPLDLKHLTQDLAVIREVYNDTLSRNSGFVPIALEDLLDTADDLAAIVDPEMIMIAEKDGEPAGVGLSLPNYNLLLARLKKTPYWLRMLHFLWLMKTTRISQGRQVMYGILPKFRDRGLHAWLLHEQFRCAKERYNSAQLGWIEDNNTEILENSVMLGAVKARTWKIFEKPI